MFWKSEMEGKSENKMKARHAIRGSSVLCGEDGRNILEHGFRQHCSYFWFTPNPVVVFKFGPMLKPINLSSMKIMISSG